MAHTLLVRNHFNCVVKVKIVTDTKFKLTYRIQGNLLIDLDVVSLVCWKYAFGMLILIILPTIWSERQSATSHLLNVYYVQLTRGVVAPAGQCSLSCCSLYGR